MQGNQLTLRVINRDINMSCVDEHTVSYVSVQTVQLSAQKCLAVVKTKTALNSHTDACVVGDQCQVVHDHNRPVNVSRYYPKAGLKHAHIVKAAIAYDQHKRGQVIMFLINQAIERKGIDHHHFFPM